MSIFSVLLLHPRALNPVASLGTPQSSPLGFVCGSRFCIQTNSHHVERSKARNRSITTRLLLDEYSQAECTWGEDFWDDCYALLALHEVREEWVALGLPDFKANLDASRDLLVTQIQANLSGPRGNKSDWYGPGYHAAGI